MPRRQFAPAALSLAISIVACQQSENPLQVTAPEIPRLSISSGVTCAVVEYRFNATGTTTPSTGWDPTTVVFKDGNGNVVDLHGVAGSGVSGLAADLAFDNRASDQAGFGGRAEQTVDDDNVDAFTSVTFQGWMRSNDPPSVTGNLGRLFDKADGFAGGGGHEVDWNAGVIHMSMIGQTSNAEVYSPASYFSANQWIFFALTYDGSATTNNVRFYRGTTSTSVQLVATASMNGGTAKNATQTMSLGNGSNGVRAFDGLLDNMRMFAAPAGNGGVLTQSQLESLRLADVQNTVLDTDSDGISDPCDLDDDGDGHSDADEIAAGSDPLNANSTPEICDGVDNDLDGQSDEGFTNTDNDAMANCVDPDDDNDGLYDSVDDDDLVVSTHFTHGTTSGTVVTVPPNVKLVLQPHNWPNTLQYVVTATGPVGIFEVLRLQFDGKQHTYQFWPGREPCLTTVCVAAFRDPPAQMDVNSVQGKGEMVSTLNGQPFVIGIAEGSTALITEITNAAGQLTDVIVESRGNMSSTAGIFDPPQNSGGVTVNGNPIPAGTSTAIGRLQASVKLSNGKSKSVTLSGTFTPSASSDGLNPLTEDVEIRVGGYTWTIAAGSFQRASDGAYVYSGTLGGVQVAVQTKTAKGGVWTFQVNATPVNALTTPTGVWIRVGNDAASTTSG